MITTNWSRQKDFYSQIFLPDWTKGNKIFMGWIAPSDLRSIVSSINREEITRLKQIYRLLKSSYRIFWNDKVSVALTFIVPMVLMSIFGAVFGGSSSGPQGIRLAVLKSKHISCSKKYRIFAGHDKGISDHQVNKDRFRNCRRIRYKFDSELCSRR